jgi:hypothetical protein
MNTLSLHVAELAEALQELRRRLRQTARLEVARAVGEALRELALSVICGRARFGTGVHGVSSPWDDPWQEPALEPWHSRAGYMPDEGEDDAEFRRRLVLPAALVAGLGAARWGYVRTRQPALALLIGLLAALTAHAGGPTLKALLRSWSTANQLLNFPGLDIDP